MQWAILGTLYQSYTNSSSVKTAQITGPLNDELHAFGIGLCNEDRVRYEAEETAALNITTETFSSMSYKLKK